MKKPAFIVFILTIAASPVWIWYIRRMSDGSDEPWGILALVTLIFFVYRFKHNTHEQQKKITLIFPAILLLIYASAYPFVGPLIRGILAMSALTLLLSRLYFNRSCHLGLWALSMMSLPLMASLQFYLGYPLRILVGNIAVAMLRLTGFGVIREGAGLIFGTSSVQIDAPCSGIKMLWVGGYLVCVLACFWKFTNTKTLFAGLIGITVIIFGNAVRTAALFYIEIRSHELPDWSHSAVGIASFVIIAIAILLFMQKLTSLKGQSA